jgi:glycosyltransferase involved in cell wall biosynthesis
MRKPGGDSGPERSALVISPEPPYPSIGGGALRTASILEYLARRYAVDLIVFGERGTALWGGLQPAAGFSPPAFRKLHFLELPFHSRRALPRVSRNLLRFARGLPPLNHRFSGFEQRIAAMIEGSRYDLALIEHFWCAPYVEVVAPRCRATILDLHNIESVLLEGCAAAERWPPLSLVFRRFARACRRAERQWLPRFSRLLVTSEEDRGRALELAPGARVDVYPNTIPALPLPVAAERNAIVFSGNLEYHPNVSAVRFFAREVWPALAARHPGFVWRIVGKNPQGVAKYVAGRERIELEGPPDDAVKALAAARVVVVPMLAGSGTRLKIIEAWAAGRAVVSTRLGAEGLPGRDGEHLLLADTAGELAAAISRLLDSPEERGRLGRAGRLLYEEHLNWDRAWGILNKLGF